MAYQTIKSEYNNFFQTYTEPPIRLLQETIFTGAVRHPPKYFPSPPDKRNDDEYYEDDYTMHVVPLNPPDTLGDDPSANWQWCLLTLAGNATILQLRKEDFVRYLKMNLASLIGTYYVQYTDTVDACSP